MGIKVDITRPGDSSYVQVIAGWFQTYSRNKGAIWRYSVYLLNGFARGLGQILDTTGTRQKTYKRKGRARLPRTLEETRHHF